MYMYRLMMEFVELLRIIRDSVCWSDLQKSPVPILLFFNSGPEISWNSHAMNPDLSCCQYNKGRNDQVVFGGCQTKAR